MHRVVFSSAMCALVLFAGPGALAQTATRVEGQKPENNVVSKATAGDTILEKFNHRIDRRRFFVVEGTMTKKWPGWRAEIPSGAKLKPWPSNGNVKACADEFALSTWGGGTAAACAYDDNSDGFFDRIAVAGGSAGRVPATKYHEAVEDVVVEGDGFKQAFYLSGVTGSTLRISYREFKNDYARPAFTQDLEFGLGSSFPQEISFKGYRVRIIAANSNGLTYSVLGRAD